MMREQPTVFVLGYFAAVHLGHRALIEQAKKIAGYGAKVTVATFDDGFYRALGRDCREIYTLVERMMVLDGLSVDIDIFPSSEDFLSLSYDEFLALLSKREPVCIVVGADYRFGKGAEGTAEMLKTYFTSRGVPVIVSDLLEFEGEKISSNLIARFLSEGDIRKANLVLGQPFFIAGTVEKGLENGKKIGFPTLNLSFLPEKFIPKHGVYASVTTINGVQYPSMTNVGQHPTLDYLSVNAETNVFGLEGDHYDEFIKVELIEYLREVRRFDSLDDLKKQLEIDKERAKNALKEKV